MNKQLGTINMARKEIAKLGKIVRPYRISSIDQELKMSITITMKPSIVPQMSHIQIYQDLVLTSRFEMR